MIVLDNSVLSAFFRLDLFNQLKSLVNKAVVPTSILVEFRVKQLQEIPEWIQVCDLSNKNQLKNIPTTLSIADVSVIQLTIKKLYPIASDDLNLRNFAKQLDL